MQKKLLSLTDRQVAELERRAKVEGISESELIRRLLGAHLGTGDDTKSILDVSGDDGVLVDLGPEGGLFCISWADGRVVASIQLEGTLYDAPGVSFEGADSSEVETQMWNRFDWMGSPRSFVAIKARNALRAFRVLYENKRTNLAEDRHAVLASMPRFHQGNPLASCQLNYITNAMWFLNDFAGAPPKCGFRRVEFICDVGGRPQSEYVEVAYWVKGVHAPRDNKRDVLFTRDEGRVMCYDSGWFFSEPGKPLTLHVKLDSLSSTASRALINPTGDRLVPGSVKDAMYAAIKNLARLLFPCD